MSFIYGRVAILQIGVPGHTGKELRSFRKDEKGIVSDGLRMTFSIEKTSEPNPNKSTITVYNLAPDTLALLKKPKCTVQLRAGFGGLIGPEVIGNLYTGDVFKTKTDKSGPDYITTIESADGLAAMQSQTLDMSFAEGAKTSSIIDKVIDSFGLGKGTVQIDDDQQYQSGLTLSGDSKNSMDTVTKKAGLEWSVQDGKIQVLPVNSSTRESAILLTSDSGLIGSPQRSGFSSSQEKKKEGVEFKSLLNPGLKIGRLVKIDSKFIDGFFIVRKLTHKGDTISGDWLTECEGAPFV